MIDKSKLLSRPLWRILAVVLTHIGPLCDDLHMSESPLPTPLPDPSIPGHEVPALKKPLPVWLSRTIIAFVAVVVAGVALLIASATVPVAWANMISNQVAGKASASIPLGMFYGFMFSFIPVVVGWQAHYKNMNKWLRLSILVLAALLALPNVLTLLVLNANTDAAVRARLNWLVNAEWFGIWSLWFMVIGVVSAVVVIFLTHIWARRGREIRKIRAAEKLVKQNEAAKAKVAEEAARDAEKQARQDARDARRNGAP